MRLGTSALLVRHLRSSSLTSVLIGVLVASTVFVIALAPRALAQLGTAELHYELNEQPRSRVDLSGTAPVTLGASSQDASLDDYLGATRTFVNALNSRLPAPLSDAAGDGAWMLRTKTLDAFFDETPTTVLSLKLAVDVDWQNHITLIEGALPVRWQQPAAGQDAEPIEVAVTSSAAETLALSLRDEIAASPAPLRVAAIYEPIAGTESYWAHGRDVLEAFEIRDSSAPLKIQNTLLVAPESVIGLHDEFSGGEFSAWIPIDQSAYTFADLDTLARQVREVTATPLQLPDRGPFGLRSALDSVFEETQSKVASTSALIALTGSGFLGVLIAAYALGIQALVSRRRTALGLASARGASPAQLRAMMVLETALVVVPGSVAAVGAAALLIPESVGLDGWVWPAAVALIPVLLALALTQGQADRESVRDDLGSRPTGSARWIAEVAVVALAALAIFLLQRRGLVASSAVVGIDPLLAATPVLLAAVVGLAVIRVYHVPLLAVHRWLRRRTAAASSVGSARAVRTPAVGLVATLALVTGISIVVFTTGMITTVAAGLRDSARDEIGADMQIAAHDLPATLVDDLESLPEIASAVSILSKSGIELADESSPREVTVILADTEALHEVRPDIPSIVGKVDGRLQLLVSSDLTRAIDGTDLRLVNSLATAVGVVPVQALPGASRNWVLVDAAASDELNLAGLVPSLILATISEGTESAAALGAAATLASAAQPEEFLTSVRVDDAASLVQKLRDAPVMSGLERSLLAAAAAALLLTMLIIALSALAAAASRNRIVAVLRILGMSQGQVRRVVAWEFAPVTVAAVVIGAALGIGLPYLVTAVLDLREFVGGAEPPHPSIDPLWVLGAIAIFVAGVVAAAVGATAAGRRLAPAGTLRMGEE